MLGIRAGSPLATDRIIQHGANVAPSDASPEPDDEQLVAQVIHRDTAAFGALFDRYASLVYALAFHLLGAADADEVVQEVFLRLWRRAHQFDPARGSFRAWFMAIARNEVLNRLRARTFQQQLQVAEQADRLLAEAADPAPDPADAVWVRERQDAVLRALGDLPPEQRQAIVLAYFGGMSHTAIAEHLGWPLGTVKKRIQLGIRKLRVALTGHRPDPEAPVGSGSREHEYPE
jgi:RNA polymerase sigma-70 factor (ECF subfamily)